MYNWSAIIQNYLLPANCVLCGHAGWQDLDLCHACYTQFTKNTPCCQRCAGSLTTATTICGACLSRPPAFDTVYAPFSYHSAIGHLIKGLKFNADYKNARTLGLLLTEQLHTAARPDCIIPVPLHKTRYRQRGFNQAIEIARTVSHNLSIPLDLTSCIRQRDTQQQTRLTSKQRRSNVKNAFCVLKPIPARHIAIVDDVMTTGATVNELAGVLKKSGVQQVDVWVCARA